MKGLREIALIHDLKKQGLSISAIARKVGCDRKTVRTHLARGLEALGKILDVPRIATALEDC
ncbi:MAG: helix-turn-helix domain-containing protein [Marivita sp.]|uniref:helix-turn-helix domain-containing protein n=1 Tax=Marivita sp. TaxID=2003365 RepID=UPI003EF901AD